MQVSIKWLKDYIDFNETAEELADKLTMAGVPVENVIRADAGLENLRQAIPAMRSLLLLAKLARGESGQVIIDYLPPMQLNVAVEPC